MTGNATHSDALVFFGATGDLAYKKIFPSLQKMIRRGNLVGSGHRCREVALDASDQLLDRARASLKEYGGGVDEAAFTKLKALLQYIDGDYSDLATFTRLRAALGEGEAPDALSRHPAQPLRERRRVARQVGLRGRRPRRHREALRPRPRDGPRPQPDAPLRLPRELRFPHRPLPRQGSRREPPLLPLREHVPRADLEPQLRRLASRSRWPSSSASRGAASSTTRPERSAT